MLQPWSDATCSGLLPNLLTNPPPLPSSPSSILPNASPRTKISKSTVWAPVPTGDATPMELGSPSFSVDAPTPSSLSSLSNSQPEPQTTTPTIQSTVVVGGSTIHSTQITPMEIGTSITVTHPGSFSTQLVPPTDGYSISPPPQPQVS